MRPHTKHLRGALVGVWTLLDTKNLTLIAAGIAFFGMFGAFPAIGAVIALWGWIAEPALIEAQVNALSAPLPTQVAELVTGRVSTLVAADATTLGWAGIVSVLLALWSARAATGALIMAMNAIYEERNRGGIMQILQAIFLTLVLVTLSLISLAALVGVPIIMAYLPLGDTVALIAEVTRWTVALLTVILALGVLYRYGPNRRVARVGWVSPGSILATLLWAFATFAFTVYLQNFANYNEVYGSIGAVIVLLLWLYLGAFICLLGAALNAELELREERDTTRGPARPMGKRGAYVADHTERPAKPGGGLDESEDRAAK